MYEIQARPASNAATRGRSGAGHCCALTGAPLRLRLSVERQKKKENMLHPKLGSVDDA
jgi:hypothetical protein